jgi:L-lactate dehydrogenase complex protein LldG
MKIEDTSNNKERVLKNIRDAFVTPSKSLDDIDNTSPIFFDFEKSILDTFTTSFHNNGGRLVYCEDFAELIESLNFFSKQENWQDLFCTEVILQQMLNRAGVKYSDNPNNILASKITVTSCQNLIARTGSIVLNSQLGSLQKAISIAQTHIVIAMVSQIVPELSVVLSMIKDSLNLNIPSNTTIINGLSSIRDIDGNTIKGVGNSQLILFLVDTK